MIPQVGRGDTGQARFTVMPEFFGFMVYPPFQDSTRSTLWAVSVGRLAADRNKRFSLQSRSQICSLGSTSRMYRLGKGNRASKNPFSLSFSSTAPSTRKGTHTAMIRNSIFLNASCKLRWWKNRHGKGRTRRYLRNRFHSLKPWHTLPTLRVTE